MTAQLEMRRLAAVGDDEKDQSAGARLKARRLALGLDVAPMAKRAGIDRATLDRVEADAPGVRATTVALVDRALSDLEEETGMDDALEEAHLLRVTMHNVYGVGEMIVEGPVDADALADAVGKILDRLKQRESE